MITQEDVSEVRKLLRELIDALKSPPPVVVRHEPRPDGLVPGELVRMAREAMAGSARAVAVPAGMTWQPGPFIPTVNGSPIQRLLELLEGLLGLGPEACGLVNDIARAPGDKGLVGALADWLLDRRLDADAEALASATSSAELVTVHRAFVGRALRRLPGEAADRAAGQVRAQLGVAAGGYDHAEALAARVRSAVMGVTP